MVKQLALCLALVSAPLMATQDPTAPLGWNSSAKPVQQKVQAKRKPLPNLQSIVCQEQAPCYAILNDAIVEQGDSVRGYRIVRINDQGVTVKKGQRQWDLSLFNQTIKQ